MKPLSVVDVKSVLHNDDLKNKLTDILSGLESADDQSSLLEWVDDKNKQFLSRCEIVQDEQEVPLLLMWFYIQLKSEWSQINTEIQYGPLLTGEVDLLLVYRSSILSTLLMEVETLLLEWDVEHATNFLAQPFLSKNDDTNKSDN